METQINGQSAAWSGIHGPRTPPGPALDQALGAGTDTAMRPSPPAALASLTRISSGLSVGLERAEKVSPAVLQRQRLGCSGGGDGATDPGRSQWDGFLLSTILAGPQPWRPGTQSSLSCFGQMPSQTRSVTRIGREPLETARWTHARRTGGIAGCRLSQRPGATAGWSAWPDALSGAEEWIDSRDGEKEGTKGKLNACSARIIIKTSILILLARNARSPDV